MVTTLAPGLPMTAMFRSLFPNTGGVFPLSVVRLFTSTAEERFQR